MWFTSHHVLKKFRKYIFLDNLELNFYFYLWFLSHQLTSLCKDQIDQMSLIVSLFLSVWFTFKMLWEINVKMSLFILPLYLLFVLLAYWSWQTCFTASQMRKRHKLRDFHHGSRPFRSSLPVQTVTGSLVLLIILRLLNHRFEKQWNVNFLGYIILWFTVHLG